LLTGIGIIETFGWSPDGRMIVFSRYEKLEISNEYGSRISIVRTDGQGLRTLTPGAADRDPDWQRRCSIYGTAKSDSLAGTSGDDVMCGLGGNDRIRGGGGNDIIIGGSGNDVIFGGPGRDWLFGSEGSDVIYSRDRERDVVDGGPDSDTGNIDAGAIDERLDLEAVRTA
jgi:Ca2+-binding RTX toxin-like protein